MFSLFICVFFLIHSLRSFFRSNVLSLSSVAAARRSQHIFKPTLFGLRSREYDASDAVCCLVCLCLRLFRSNRLHWSEYVCRFIYFRCWVEEKKTTKKKQHKTCFYCNSSFTRVRVRMQCEQTERNEEANSSSSSSNGNGATTTTHLI